MKLKKMPERLTVGVIADDTELRKWAERLADANVHGPAAVLFHAADGVNAVADTVEKLTVEVEVLREALAIVFAHIDQRPEYVTALRNSTDTSGDYGRWSGHAEARRQLAEALDVTVPYIVPPMPLNPHTGRPVLRPPNLGVDLDTGKGE